MLRTARILLPGRLSDGTVLTWAEIAALASYPEGIDGYTDWACLVELRPGIDARSLPRAAAGKFDDTTITRLVTTLTGPGAEPWSWSPSALGSDVTQSATSTPVPRPERAQLRELTERWASEGFSGKAWSGDISIEAPSYADSMIVTAPDNVLQQLTEAGLEAHRVSRRRRIPIWRD